MDDEKHKFGKIQKGDFIEIDYTGRIKQTNQIFDLTDEKIAEENNIHKEGFKYKPVIICVGNRDVVKGLDDFLVGKEIGEYKVELSPKEAFGEKEANLTKVFSINHFWQQKINPVPGLQMNFDGVIGTVRSVTSGRVVVDFNHPLAGKQVVYEVKIKRVVENDAEKLKGFASLYLDADASLESGIAKIELKKDLSKEAKDELREKIKKSIPSIETIEFIEVKNKGDSKKPE